SMALLQATDHVDILDEDIVPALYCLLANRAMGIVHSDIAEKENLETLTRHLRRDGDDLDQEEMIGLHTRQKIGIQHGIFAALNLVFGQRHGGERLAILVAGRINLRALAAGIRPGEEAIVI